jgi:hypothetical protein
MELLIEVEEGIQEIDCPATFTSFTSSKFNGAVPKKRCININIISE